MLIHVDALGVARFASKDTSRTAIGNIKIDPDGTCWGCDGSIAVKAIPLPVDSNLFPEVPGLPADAVTPKEAVLIPADVALAVAKGVPKKSPVQTVQILQIGETVYLVTSDFETHSVRPVTQGVDTYPDVTQVWPNGEVNEDAHISRYSIELLSKLAMFAKATAKKGHIVATVDVVLRGENVAASMDWVSEGQTEFSAIIMPCRKVS